MESLIVFAAIAFTINKLVSSIKALKARDWSTPLTQLLAFVIGVAVVSLAANADITAGYTLPGFQMALGKLDFASIALFSLLASSSGSFAYDFKKAIDNSDSAAEPRLLQPNGVQGVVTPR